MEQENSNQTLTSEIESQQILPDKKRCKYCMSQIPSEARVCSYCHRDQNWFFYRFHIEHIGLLLTLGIIAFSYLQFHEARKERISASKALQRAEQAEFSARSTSEEMKVLSKDMNTVSKEARRKVDQIENIVKDAKSALDDIKSISEFTLLMTKAKNDDRSSFDALIRIANSKNHPFSQIAIQSLLQITTDMSLMSVFGQRVDWNKHNIDPNKASFKDFVKAMDLEIPFRQSTIIETIWQQERFSKYERMGFLINIIINTKSINCLNKACRLLDQEAKIKKNILAYGEYLEWWNRKRKEYEYK